MPCNVHFLRMPHSWVIDYIKLKSDNKLLKWQMYYIIFKFYVIRIYEYVM